VPAWPSFHAFGALVVTDGHTSTIRVSAAESRLLAALVLAFPAPVTEDRLTDVVWPSSPPPRTARQSLHNHVSRLRQRLGPDALIRR
jgi:DNA-binding SARP family transcriptional activator